MQCRRHRFDLLGGKYPLEEEMATHSSTLARKIPWTEEPGSPGGRKQLDMTEDAHAHICTVVSVLKNLHSVFDNSCTNLYSHQQLCSRVPFSPHRFQHLLFIVFLIIAIMTGVRWHLIVVLIFISLMITEVELLFMCLLAISISSLEKCLLNFSAHF